VQGAGRRAQKKVLVLPYFDNVWARLGKSEASYSAAQLRRIVEGASVKIKISGYVTIALL
jgi:hypothetical protein